MSVEIGQKVPLKTINPTPEDEKLLERGNELLEHLKKIALNHKQLDYQITDEEFAVYKEFEFVWNYIHDKYSVDLEEIRKHQKEHAGRNDGGNGGGIRDDCAASTSCALENGEISS